MKNYKIFVLCILLSPLISSCAVPVGGNNEIQLELCDGYDFNKYFPGRDGRPFSVSYNIHRKMLFDKNGCQYNISFGEGIGLKSLYTEELQQSHKEKKYNACFQNLEQEFDTAYAGDIKRKLLKVSEKYTNPYGVCEVWYPVYLEGDRLPKGLQTPSSLFSKDFIAFIARKKDTPDSIRNYIFSMKWIKNSGVYDYAATAATSIDIQFRSAYEAVFGEYVMTYYYIKKYTSLRERRDTFRKLATYYGNLAYRSAGEGMLPYQHLFNVHQRKKTALLFSQRVFDYIFAMHEEHYVNTVKHQYKERIKLNCRHYIIQGRYEKQFRERIARKISREEYMTFKSSLVNAMESGQERCVND